jgi:hypothetical protein
VNKSQDNSLRVSRVQLVSYGLALLGVVAGISAHVAFANHYTPFQFSLLSLLWSALPFLLCAVVAFAVRHFRLAGIAVAVVTSLLLLSCLRYTGVTKHDGQPFFILGFMPLFQLFAVIAFLTPVLCAALFFHQRHADNPNERIA